MRNRVLMIVGLLGGLLCRPSAHAQATFNPSALDPLHPPAAATQTPASEPPVSSENHAGARANRPPARRPAPERHEAAETRPAEPDAPGKIAARRGNVQFGPPRPPPVTAGTLVVPTAPPPGVVIPPPIAVATRPPPPPIPATVDPKAVGDVAAIRDGTRITFGKDSSDLNPATAAAIQAVLRAAPASDQTTFNVTAFAAGTPEDPSTARRLSLARALAVRSVLIEQGIPSVRIYVKALGATVVSGDDAPQDRVDITFVAPPPATRPTPP